MKIRMISENGKKYIDLEKKVIKERNEETMEVIEFDYDGIVKSFGSIDEYVRYNMRVWGFKIV